MHDVSLVDVSTAPTDLISNMKACIPIEWLSEAGWQKIKYNTTNLCLLNNISMSSPGRPRVKSIGVRESECQVSHNF